VKENTPHQNSKTRHAKKNKFMIFSLGEHRFAISLSQVKEVIAMTDITRLPNVPGYFCGLINLRGQIISIIELAQKLEFNGLAKSAKPCIIISEVSGMVLGFIVDDVLEVMGLEEEQVERNIDIQSKVSRDHIAGVAKIDGRGLIIILDLVKTLGVEDFKIIAEHMRKQVS
jgi:purine-binding chemotaxis protein CheW